MLIHKLSYSSKNSSNVFPDIERMLSIYNIRPSCNMTVLSFSLYFLITPITVTFSPPSFILSGIK